MDKLQFLIRAPRRTPVNSFSELVRERILPRVVAAEPARCKLTITDIEPPRLSIIPFRKRRVAVLSIWADGGAAPWLDAIGSDCGCLVEGYRVRESVPLAYERNWADGELTPGVGLLTVFSRRSGLSDEELIARWHGGHTPLSLRLHPLWSYVRNEVIEPLTEATPPRDAVVEEHFRTREALLRPGQFFGAGLGMLTNMAKVGRDIAGFIDLLSIETYLVRELHVRS